MKLLPYDSFTIQTRDPLPVVRQRLNERVEAARIRFGFSRNHALYQGTVSEVGFKITRIIHYKNSFLPVIRGSFQQQVDGTTAIYIQMGPHPFVMAFLGFWYLAWFSGTIPIILVGGIPVEVAGLFIGLPILMSVVFWWAFWFEADRSRRELTAILVGEVGLGGEGSDRYPTQAAQQGLLVIGAIVFLGIAFAVWKMIFPAFLSFETKEITVTANPCQIEATGSPYCKFSAVLTITGHPSASVIAISADGKTLVSGGDDKAIKVWDLATGKLQRTLQSDSGKVLSVAISADGKTVVSGSGDRMVRVWNLTTGKRQALLKGHEGDVTSVAISQDSKTIASGSWGTIKVWDLATGKLKFTLPKDTSKSVINIGPIAIEEDSYPSGRVAISQNGKTAILVNNRVTVWDLTTGQLQTSFKQGFGHDLSADISPDGKVAVIQYQMYNHGGKVRVWDLVTGKEKASRSFTGSWISATPMALGRERAIDYSNGAMRVWHLSQNQLEAIFNTEWVSTIALSADGKTVVAITGDRSFKDAKIKVWR
ncbi:MAG TPA: hypothetical protein DC064_22620 [Cyanobacteria bacterium UBA9273]|nr:hypothetical protein [Cyanobacteria bacterium UBA9273]